MLSRYNRYIKFPLLKAKLYQLSPNHSPNYIFSSCFCVIFMDSQRSTIFSIYSLASPLHFRTIDIEITSPRISLRDGELLAIEFQYNNRTFGIVTKPYLFQQLTDMLASEQESTIITDISTWEQRVENVAMVEKIKNPFVKNYTVSEGYTTWETKWTVSNELGLGVQKNGNQVQLWMCKDGKVKMVHSMEVLFLGEVSRIRVLPGTELLCIAFKSEPVLWFYNIDTGEISEFSLKEDFTETELGVLDFILPKEIMRQEILLITTRSLYLLSLSKYLNNQKPLTKLPLPDSLPHSRLLHLQDHSLSYYLLITQNPHSKKDYTLKIIKTFGTTNIILSIPLHKKVIHSDFSSKLLILCFDDGSVELVQITTLDQEGKFKEPVRLKLKEEDRERYGVRGEEKFRRVKISYNRTYVVGVIGNLMVVWRVGSLLEGDGGYEVSVFRKRILEVENWRVSEECLWVTMEDKNCVVYLES